jgi:ERCC4-related helicase
MMTSPLSGITPRSYQSHILETCKKDNCLVVLPTGTGKTLIAIMLAIDHFTKNPLQKILILAPTRPLIEQHMKSFKELLPEDWADMQLFTGKTPAPQRKKIWQTAEFIFSTPQCISNDLKKNLYELSDVSLLVQDECHRCLKNYSYNLIAQKFKEQSPNGKVLGLTASPGSDKKTIQQVCQNLGINSVEIRTRDSPDVKPYLQELEFEKIEVPFPKEFQEIRYLLQEVCNDKIQELKNRKVLFSNPSKSALIMCQTKLFSQIKRSRNPNAMRAVSVCAQAIKIQHAMELMETQTLSSFINYIKELFKQAAQQKSKGVQQLAKDARLNKAYTLALSCGIEHPKLETLKDLIELQIEDNPNAKIIVFTQFRETVNKIAEILSKNPKIKPKSFVGQAKKSHGMDSKGVEKFTGINQKQQKAIIEEFSQGKINVLVATSIAEEGLDIPEVSEVIFYEPVPSAIRKIQRAGRTARLKPGALKILITKDTRDVSYHYASKAKEKRMYNAIDSLKKDMKSLEDKQEKLKI